jgi:hypothetical protein
LITNVSKNCESKSSLSINLGNFKTFSRPCFCVLQLCLHNPVLTQLTMVLALFWLPLTVCFWSSPRTFKQKGKKKKVLKDTLGLLWAFTTSNMLAVLIVHPSPPINPKPTPTKFSSKNFFKFYFFSKFQHFQQIR